MDKGEVRKVLNCPSKHLLRLALDLVNLKTKELITIENVDIKGNTEQETAEIMNCSINTIKNYKKKAYDKMAKAWANEDLIQKILDTF